MTYELAIGVSGGLDSTMAYFYALQEMKLQEKDIGLFYVDCGQGYAQKEQDVLKKLGLKYELIKIPVCSLSRQEETLVSYMIPGRNMFIASLLATITNKVWIVATKNDNHVNNTDKNSDFFDRVSKLFSYVFKRNILVESPFLFWSKQKIIQWGMNNGLKEIIEKTSSCYHPTLINCGECHACLKKYMATINIDNLNIEFKTNPIYSEIAYKKYLEYIKLQTSNNYQIYSQETVNTYLKHFENTFSLRGVKERYSL